MERTMLRKLMIVAVLSTSAACATGYQVDGFKGGQEPKWRAVDVLEIKARGNGYTSSKKLGRMTLLRAAESAIEAKYRYFIEIGSENKGRESTAYLPTTTTNTYTGSYVGNTYTGTTTSYTTGGPISVFKPGVDIDQAQVLVQNRGIEIFHGPGVLKLRMVVEQAFFKSVRQKAGDGIDAEFFHKACAMFFHRLRADMQPFADIRGGQAGGDQRQHLAFARGQRAGAVAPFENSEHVFRGVRLAGHQRRQAGAQFVFAAALEKKPVDAGSDPVGEHACGGETGEHRDDCFGAPAPHFGVDFRAIGERHAHIERQQIRAELAAESNRLQPIRCGGGDNNARHSGEQVGKPFAHHFMVVGDDDAYAGIGGGAMQGPASCCGLRLMEKS